MRKLLWLLILAPILAHGQILAPIFQKAPGTAVVTDSCTGGLVFSWHAENTDVTLGGVAGGVNNGCSVGDTTATAVGASLGTTYVKDGTYSVTSAGYNKNYTFTVSTEDLINHTAGTIDTWVYVTSFGSGAEIVSTIVDGSNYIRVRQETVSTEQHFRIAHDAGGTVRAAGDTITGGFSLNTWYHIIAKWDYTAHGGNYLQICANTTTGTTNCGVNTNALGTWAGTISTLNVGGVSSTATEYVDNVKVYSSWQ